MSERGQLVVDHVEEYRDWYIRLRVHRHGEGCGAGKTATVTAHQNKPNASALARAVVPKTEASTDRSARKSWGIDMPPHDSEDVLTGVLESAKEWVDAQRADEYGTKESVTIAFERAFADERDGDGP